VGFLSKGEVSKRSFLRTKNKVNASTSLSNPLFRSAGALTATFFCLATKERKSALYVAHWATEINLSFCFLVLWDAHHQFVCEAHPTATYFEHSFFTRN
jgi:hypothetical protein